MVGDYDIGPDDGVPDHNNQWLVDLEVRVDDKHFRYCLIQSNPLFPLLSSSYLIFVGDRPRGVTPSRLRY